MNSKVDILVADDIESIISALLIIQEKEQLNNETEETKINKIRKLN